MIEYVRELNKNYLKINTDKTADNYCMKMVENNEINEFIKAESTILNNRLSYQYDISGMRSLTDYYDRKDIGIREIKDLAEFLGNCIDNCRKYLLDPDGICFNPDYLYVAREKFKGIYCTEIATPARQGLKNLFEYLLGKINHLDKQAVVTGYGLYKTICDDTVPIEKIFCGVGELSCEDNNVKTIYTESERYNDSIMPEPVHVQKTVDNRLRYGVIFGGAILVFFFLALLFNNKLLYVFCALVAVGYMVLLKGGRLSGFMPETVNVPYTRTTHKIVTEIDDYPETVPLSEEPMEVNIANDSLKPENNGTMLLTFGIRLLEYRGSSMDVVNEYPIYDSPVVLGTGDGADVRLKGAGISRNHARLSREGDMLFIKDLNSTNGTWVNEHRLEVYEMCPVKEEDIIRLAGIRYGISVDY